MLLAAAAMLVLALGAVLLVVLTEFLGSASAGPDEPGAHEEGPAEPELDGAQQPRTP
ncbi:hypothetical protein [Amycolatopsis anabasis]|uniref:hypothetical protein n=1 Tax=Amycolatopsis anabasis TaxID=1840409 RepID=UPI00131B099B|nr:hypothetical protein [Amycolatopsis anabasis]